MATTTAANAGLKSTNRADGSLYPVVVALIEGVLVGAIVGASISTINRETEKLLLLLLPITLLHPHSN
jgi:hypothetical protein